MKNLKVFDLKKNQLECNEDFRGLMKFLGLRKVNMMMRHDCSWKISKNCLCIKITLGNRGAHAEFEEMKATFYEEMSPAIEWNELARSICKRDEENKLTDKEVLDVIDESEDDYDDEVEPTENVLEEDSEDVDISEWKEEATTKKAIPSTKAPKEKSTAKPKTTTSVPPLVVDSNNENDESAADENYDYSEEDDEDEDREDESIVRVEKPINNKNILMDVIEVTKKKIDNRIFGENFKKFDAVWLSWHLQFDYFRRWWWRRDRRSCHRGSSH